MESLLPPNVPIEPDAEWWDTAALEAARAAVEDKDTWTVLVTNRNVAFEVRIVSHNIAAGKSRILLLPWPFLYSWH